MILSLDTRLADRTLGVCPLSMSRPNLVRSKSSAIQPDDPFHVPVKPPRIDTGVDVLEKARKDLSEAQRSKTQMQFQMQDLTEETQRLRIQSMLDRRRINELIQERTNLTARMRDRDEELRAKAKLLEVSLRTPLYDIWSSSIH